MARVRHALALNNVELSVIPKDTAKESLAVVSATASVQIHVAQSEGIVCGMRTNKDTSYLISYLHKVHPLKESLLESGTDCSRGQQRFGPW